MAIAIAARPPDFSIVVPAHNEVANIAPMLAELRAVMAPLGRFEIIYVDDGSDDGTLAVLRDRVVVDAVNRIEDQDLFLRGVVRWLGYPLASVPFRQGLRQHGDSKYSLRRMVELAVTGIAAHSLRPLRFAIWLALGFAAVGAGLVVYSIVSFLFVQHTV